MRYQEECKKYFQSVDNVLNNAILGIKVQLAEGNNEEFFKLCSSIKETEIELNEMAEKVGELSDNLMQVGEFDNVLAYKEIQFKLEDLIFELIFYVETALKYKDIEVDMDSLDESFKNYIDIKKTYNL
ncbi:hypothetical protein [Clostridium perfringens]|uniref:hypothetical protein n=1 Tax=Clostridium perfringens TaxID=1502 RepID=UPI00224533E2|nr:hypothetical protein [Clostridium perfringens]MCX0367875.1 hypothetical protein [Clostridium perfringens]